MHLPTWVVLRGISFSLLGFASLIVLAQSELEPGVLQTALWNLDIQVATLVLLLFLPILAARLRHTGTEIGLQVEDRRFACMVEAALYGLMLIQPIMTWLVAILSKHRIAILGASLPSLASGDALMGQ